ncbi:DUF3488 and transglutaminase-like domain-containing protein [Jatrophihabitans telluris]|uniref:DUF3488 and transglutaminase-like domain-containing protein n=1 Tax=Jatrophihabitans telluris TaxID=2038343 RepID=A0ABY4QU86_9ACTN|nr:DUF3488 and transglutaminase-like domain-containing protein [Jatrophihabitans telluris]UQX87200.1 DUF3488 and transglutaminase-like domain-containing protein [Jatrophihabitans telluris]
MTATSARPAGASRAQRPAGRTPSGPAGPGAQARAEGRLLAVGTATVTAGVLLTMLPMKSVYTDWTWFFACAGCALPYLAVVLPFRLRMKNDWWQVWLGLLACVVVLIWAFLPQHLIAGVVPSLGTGSDLRALLTDAHQSMQVEHAPLPSTSALRFLTAAAVILLVALADALGVLMRRPLLAAAPLLEVLAVASATSGRAAGPLVFAGAAIGFLLILVAGTRLQDRDWGPSVDGSAGRLGGARRMAVTGIIAALIVPIVLPSVSVNLLARAAHHNGTGSGSGSGSNIELNDTADLSGSLKRGDPVPLLQVHVGSTDRPFYVRQKVLDVFDNSGWIASTEDAAETRPVYRRDFSAEPALTSGNQDSTQVKEMQARFQVLQLGGNSLPLLANPVDLQVGIGARWDPTTSTVAGASLSTGVSYSETVAQPDPSEAALRNAPSWRPTGNTALDARYLKLPPQPAEVTQLAQRLTGGQTSDYDKARAISAYFTDAANGFTYSLETAPIANGDSALLSFLHNKQGFCQQYAAAAAVLMRAAGLPSRVVLGYTHQGPDADGNFTVTTADAHAWVEVYFTAIGWIPFDPTPLSGVDSARAVPLPWATHATSAPSNSASATTSRSRTNDVPSARRTDAAQQNSTTGGGSGLHVPWKHLAIALAVILAVLLLVTGPQLLRRRQRHRRFARAIGSGSPEPLWEELAANAVDRGQLWPETVTVGQVPGWLREHGVDVRGSEAVAALALQVERARFSSTGASGVDESAVTGVDQAMRRWGRRAERRQRIGRWLLPASVIRRSTDHRR